MLFSNAGVFEYNAGTWESISSGGGGTDLGPDQCGHRCAGVRTATPRERHYDTPGAERNSLQEIGALESNDAIQDEEIADIETEQTTQNQRLSALEHSTSGGGTSPAAADFDSGLEEVHNAGEAVRTAPYNSSSGLD